MKWVRLTCGQEAVVVVDLPDGLTTAEYREAALRELDASGGAEWVDVSGDVEVHGEPIGYRDEEPPIRWPSAATRRFTPDAVSLNVEAATAAVREHERRNRR